MKKLIVAAIIVLAFGATSDWADAAVLSGHVYYSSWPDMTVGPGRWVRVYSSPTQYDSVETGNDGDYNYPFTAPKYFDNVYCHFETEDAYWTGHRHIETTLYGDAHYDFYVDPMWKTKK